MIHQTVAIPEHDYSLFLEVVKRFKWKVETKIPVSKTISNEKAVLMEEIKDAVQEFSLIRQGKLKGISAKDLLNEL